ncbi:LamG-like jellyroll fold domain-containing protein [Chrysiogenes arsenatis]|uniref:LamG-like jellyroll fold domain-containing protein n=1 Tax=Chrysiogenes arsenatis TaxID=309797 RepID=UPI0003FF745E|nr:LamG-like jellyroll fold domain-containing protein [Chrysiogenes arsenatis]
MSLSQNSTNNYPGSQPHPLTGAPTLPRLVPVYIKNILAGAVWKYDWQSFEDVGWVQTFTKINNSYYYRDGYRIESVPSPEAPIEIVNAIKDIIGEKPPIQKDYAPIVPQLTDVYVNRLHSQNINQPTTVQNITGWAAVGNLPAAKSLSQAIVTKSRVYFIGGWTYDPYSSYVNSNKVYSAPINEDGTLGAWSAANDLLIPIASSQAIVTNSRVYLLGGASYEVLVDGGHREYRESVIQSAPINEDGTLGAWSISGNLPVTISFHQAIVTKNRVYIVGGTISSHLQNGMTSDNNYSAPINEDGTLGAWSAANDLLIPVIAHQAIVTNSRVYLLGGSKVFEQYGYLVQMQDIQSAPINEDGTLGAWSISGNIGINANPFPSPHQAIVTKNRVYLIGKSNTYTAQISDEGILGSWSATAGSLPDSSQAIITKNRVYLLGGSSGSNAISTIYSAPFADGWEITENKYTKIEYPPTESTGEDKVVDLGEYGDFILNPDGTISFTSEVGLVHHWPLQENLNDIVGGLHASMKDWSDPAVFSVENGIKYFTTTAGDNGCGMDTEYFTQSYNEYTISLFIMQNTAVPDNFRDLFQFAYTQPDIPVGQYQYSVLYGFKTVSSGVVRIVFQWRTPGTSSWPLIFVPIPEYSNQVFHVCVTYKDQFLRLYLNGVEVSSSATVGNLTLGGVEPDYGYSSIGSPHGYEIERMFNFKIFDRALSQSEIANENIRKGERPVVGGSRPEMTINRVAASRGCVALRDPVGSFQDGTLSVAGRVGGISFGVGG